MDIRKIMILVKQEDKTPNIEHFWIDKENGKIEITYVQGKTYSYNQRNIEILTNPKVLNLNGKVAY